MLFGLALLAGLVGYVVIDSFDNGEDSIDMDSEGNLNVPDTVVTDVNNLVDLVSDDPDVVETFIENTDTTAIETTNAGAVIEGTDDDDLIYGGHANDVIFGGDGNYTINGGSGDDQLRGGDGSNTINGEDGNDILFAGNGNVDQSSNTLSGGGGNDILYGSNEPQNFLNGGAGDDIIHMCGHDTATGGEGVDSYRSSADYSNGEVSTITDYNAEEDQIIVEYATDSVNDSALDEPEVSININGDDAVVCLDGEEFIVVQGAANSLTIADILLQANLAP